MGFDNTTFTNQVRIKNITIEYTKKLPILTSSSKTNRVLYHLKVKKNSKVTNTINISIHIFFVSTSRSNIKYECVFCYKQPDHNTVYKEIPVKYFQNNFDSLFHHLLEVKEREHILIKRELQRNPTCRKAPQLVIFHLQ